MIQLRLAQFADASFGFVHVHADGKANAYYRGKPMDRNAAELAMDEHKTRHTPTQLPGADPAMVARTAIHVGEEVRLDWTPPKVQGHATQIFQAGFKSALEDLGIEPPDESEPFEVPVVAVGERSDVGTN